ncbi:MAG TPA: DUF1192 domain-containing protein [Roseomonas sp.]|jgi:uncharacterized small protein (DUF1192 family)
MALFEEEERPRPRRGFVPPSFDGWSISDLTDHIAALREEIARTETTIQARETQKGAAEAFFRKG